MQENAWDTGESSVNPLRSVACRVIRMYSRGESPTSKEGDLAVTYLSRQARAYLSCQTSKVEDQANTFFAEKYEWFRGKEKTFSMKTEEDVIAMTVYRFIKWIGDERKKTEPTTARHWRAEPLEKTEKNVVPAVLRPEEIPTTFDASEKDAVDYGDLEHASKEELADDARLTKETDFAKFLQGLKERQDKEGILYVTLIRLTLRENKQHSREDLTLDRMLREQAMTRSPRIRTLTVKRTHKKLF